MSKEKNKNTFRVAALLLVACLISSVMLSGTFAKYTSEYAGQDTALVARWSFEALGGTLATEDPTEIKLALFDHVYNTHINRTAADEETYIIAPGVSGDFTIQMAYLADVDADVKITFQESGDLSGQNFPIEYSADGGSTWVAYDELAEEFIDQIITTGITEAVADDTFTIASVDDEETDAINISQTILWRWPYYVDDASDDVDTGLGADSNTQFSGVLATRTSYGIKVTVKATQVRPDSTTLSIESISGTPQVSQTLTVEGLTPEAATVSYEWQSSTSSNGTYSAIVGAADADTYTLVGADEDMYIRVVITGTGGDAGLGTVTSAPVGPIAAAPPAGD
jgi:hypothetical protein